MSDPGPMPFKPGDVVKLRSGGPRMTVHAVKGLTADHLYVWVIWFDCGDELKRDQIPTDLLEIAPAGPTK